MTPPAPPRLGLLRQLPLVARVWLLSLALGGTVWLLLDRHQREELQALFHSELELELERRARIDRERFDDQVQWLHHAAKLVVSQKRFMDYLLSRPWPREEGGELRHYDRLPPWMPPSSVLRAFFYARFALLVDPQGEVREAYHHLDHGPGGRHELPAEFLHPSLILRKLSHNQSYLTELGGIPYIVTARQALDDAGRPLATLMLVVPIDDEFLFRAGGIHASHVTALVDDQGRVVASSAPERIPDGTPTASLAGRYLAAGNSFFDYGASDLELQFTSFIPTARAEQLATAVTTKDTQQRLVLVVVLVLGFTLLVTWLAARVLRLSERVMGFGRERLGLAGSAQELRGDELAVLEGQFERLGRAVLESRRQLRRESAEKIELTRKAVLGEQHASELRRLRLLTETLGLGIVLVREHGLSPFNPLMERFAGECGGLDRFELPTDARERELEFEDCHGAPRVFLITRYRLLEEEALLVRDITAQRHAERELRLIANFPSQNPNPVLRIASDGTIQYANQACLRLLDELCLKEGMRLPTEWRVRLEEALEKPQLGQMEITAGGRIYSFAPALIEGAELLYLYGRDVTLAREADRELRLAAAVFEHVLDAIMVTGPDGRITQVNPAFTEITGHPAEAVLGKTPRVLKSGRHGDDFYARLWHTLDHEGEWRGEIWNRRSGGEIFPCQSSISVIRGADGEVAAYIAVFSDITERKAQEQRLSDMAYQDALTGLPNRVLFNDRLHQALALAARQQQHLAVLFLDLDGFKGVNDRFGHEIGDLLLQEAAARLTDCVRESDTVARLGGDEFVALILDIPDRRALVTVAEKICRQVAAPYHLEGHEAQVSASVGIACYPGDSDDPERLIKLADTAMYRAKQDGKNRWWFHSEVMPGEEEG